MKWLSDVARSIVQGVGRLFRKKGKPRKRSAKDPDFDWKLRDNVKRHRM